MAKLKLLMPQYYKEFKCIGSECENTCCQIWRVFIDKATYEKYRKIEEKSKTQKNTVLSPLANGNVVRYKKEDKNDDAYGVIVLDKDSKKCPFLNEKNLCDIYIHLGPSHMSKVCKIYPRSVSMVDENIEASLTMSCPEAARTALLNKNKMEFEEIYIDENDDLLSNIHNLFSTKNDIEKNEHKYFWNIRIASIYILQNRKFDIVNRLMILGMLHKKIKAAIEKENFDLIPLEIESFIRHLESVDNDIFANISGNISAQISVYEMLLKSLVSVSRESFQNIIKKARKLVNDFKDESKNNEYTKLKLGYKKFTEVDGEFSHILENYLVNDYFLKLMPFGYYDTFDDYFMQLCFNYTFIQLIALGYLYENQNLGVEDMIEIIHFVSREFTHNESFLPVTKINISSINFDTLAGLYTIIF